MWAIALILEQVYMHVHQMLLCSRSIREPKWHPFILQQNYRTHRETRLLPTRVVQCTKTALCSIKTFFAFNLTMISQNSILFWAPVNVNFDVCAVIFTMHRFNMSDSLYMHCIIAVTLVQIHSAQLFCSCGWKSTDHI